MAKNRALYGWEKPKGPAKPKKEMPFKASRRHEYWSIDIRYIKHHQLLDIKGPVYVISVLENFSRMLLASIISETLPTCGCSRLLYATTVLQRPLSQTAGESSIQIVQWLSMKYLTFAKSGLIHGRGGKITLRLTLG